MSVRIVMYVVIVIGVIAVGSLWLREVRADRARAAAVEDPPGMDRLREQAADQSALDDRGRWSR